MKGDRLESLIIAILIMIVMIIINIGAYYLIVTLHLIPFVVLGIAIVLVGIYILYDALRKGNL